jgi:cytoskeleton protein RodZ
MIGADLASARRARSLSIDEISRATKISPTLLKALENDDFERLPRGLFTRGYLRAYAREVGIDPESVVQRYRESVEVRTLEPQETQGADSDANEDAGRAIEPDERLASSRHTEVLEIAVIVIVAAAYLVSQRPARSARAPEPAVAQSAVAPSPTPVGTTGVGGSVTRPLNVEIRATGPCWVEATVDGEPVVARLMNAGERQILPVVDRVALRVGDPAAFAFAIDGVVGRPFGRAGVPKRIEIDRQNYGSLLAPRIAQP